MTGKIRVRCRGFRDLVVACVNQVYNKFICDDWEDTRSL